MRHADTENRYNDLGIRLEVLVFLSGLLGFEYSQRTRSVQSAISRGAAKIRDKGVQIR